jgi:uncharacterized protein YbjT (DUF2867 family)
MNDLNNTLVTVFGGGGFVGRYVVQDLLRAGARVRVAQRRPKQAWFLKALANLGQIQFVGADVTRADTVAAAVAGADAVINLVGAFADMDAVQHRGAATVAQAAAEAGAKALVQLSAIGADPESASAYGRSKGEGEAAVRAAFPSAAIVRPSIVFGREDQFVNRFAGLLSMLPVVPVIGGNAKFQPVFVGDVAQAVVASLAGNAAGETFELGGPEVISMLQLNQRIGQLIGRERFLIEVPDVVSGVLATATGWLPAAPITRDQWLMLQSDNVVAVGANGLEALGITPTSLDAVAGRWLVQYRKHGRFGGKAAA